MRIENWFYTIPLRSRSLFRRREVERDLDDELQYHLERKIEEYAARGFSAEEARNAALRGMDGLTQRKEECRDMRGFNVFENTVRDIRFSLRVLAKSPGFTSIAALTLALAIGANAVVFGVVNGLLLRPLNLPQPESLYGIEHRHEYSMYESYPDYLDLRDRNRSFDALAGFSIDQVGLDTGDSAYHSWISLVTGNYFDALRIRPYLGRFFHAADEHGPNSAPFIVLSYDYWRSNFGADRTVIGRMVRLNKHPFTIVGVAPSGFDGVMHFGTSNFYVPFVNQEQVEGKNTLDARATQSIFMTFGHLKPGVSVAVYREGTEAVLVSLAGGALGLWASVVLLHALSAWNPFPRFPQLNIPVSPDGNLYAIALGLALASALLFGIVPVRQVLRADPYQIVKAGPSGTVGRRSNLRDLLLAAQIAICAVLVTSSMVAIRGLARSLDSNFGFEPRNAILADTDLALAGYRVDQAPEVQKRMIDAVAAIPDVEAVGLEGRLPLAGGGFEAAIFTDQTADLRPSNSVANAMRFNISPGYLQAAHTVLLSGRSFSWHDDKDSPRVALVNRVLARRLFGSDSKAVNGYFKLRDGTRTEIVGVVENGKYMNLTEDPKPALFLPILQAPMSETWLILRSKRDPRQLVPVVRTALRSVDREPPVYIQTWNQQLDLALFPSRMASLSLGVLGAMGAVLSISGIFGMAAYSVSKRLRELGIRVALGARRKEILRAAFGRALRLLAFGSAAGLALGVLSARVLASIVYQATPRDPLVLTGAVLAMMLLGLLATWIPAQRALSLDPAVLLREE